MATANTTTKQSRKELLKREDAFINAASTSVEWANEHKREVLTTAAVIAALIAGGVAIAEYMSGRTAASSSEFLSAMTVLEARVIAPPTEGMAQGEAAPEVANPNAKPPTFSNEKDRDLAARDAFRKVAQMGGGAATLARFMAADLSEKLGEQQEAEKGFGELVTTLGPKDSLYFLAVERLAYAQEARGDHAAAIATLDKLKGDGFYADYATFHQGRLHLAKGDKDEARKLFTRVKESFPKSSTLQQADEYLSLLGPAPASTTPGSIAPAAPPPAMPGVGAAGTAPAAGGGAPSADAAQKAPGQP